MNLTAGYNADVARVYGITEALLLDTIVFYSRASKRKDGFCWFTADEFELKTAVKRSAMARAVKHLEKLGVLKTKNTYIIGTQIKCKHYRIVNEISQNGKSDCTEMIQSESTETIQSESTEMIQSVNNSNRTLTELYISKDIGDTPQNEKSVDKKEYGNHEINSLMEYFEKQTGIVANRAKANRNACYNLIRSRTYDGAKVVVDLVAKAIKSDDLYAPRISSFRDLQGQYEKLSKLEAWNAHKAAMTASEPPTMRSPANFYKTFDFTVKEYTPEEIAEQDAERAKVSQQIKEARAKMPFLNENKGKGRETRNER